MILGNVEHHHSGPTMRLPYRRFVLLEDALGDAGFERHLLSAGAVFGRQHREPDRPRGFDDQTGARPGWNAAVARREHVNRILTRLSRPTISACRSTAVSSSFWPAPMNITRPSERRGSSWSARN